MYCVGDYLLEREHAQTLVHAGRVGQNGSQDRLKDQSKVQCPVSHSLMENGVATSLANDQIGPLNDHNRDEERSVAGVLELLAVEIGLKGEVRSVRMLGGEGS